MFRLPQSRIWQGVFGRIKVCAYLLKWLLKHCHSGATWVQAAAFPGPERGTEWKASNGLNYRIFSGVYFCAPADLESPEEAALAGLGGRRLTRTIGADPAALSPEWAASEDLQRETD